MVAGKLMGVGTEENKGKKENNKSLGNKNKK